MPSTLDYKMPVSLCQGWEGRLCYHSLIAAMILTCKPKDEQVEGELLEKSKSKDVLFIRSKKKLLFWTTVSEVFKAG